MQVEQCPVIAAKMNGPGPAKYKLPGTFGYMYHDATRKKMPAFSFGKRFNISHESCSPGPSYMVPQFVTRTGRATAPAYSLYGRQPEKTFNHTPAPGQYSPEKYPIPHNKRAPSYSFGGRAKESRVEKSPAPNAYKLPSLIGSECIARHSAPSHSICGRPKIGGCYEDLKKTPGPGTYKVCDPNTYLSRGPAYSIKGRHDIIQDKVIVPGPGAYRPEKVWINKKTGPSFSFGIRHTQYITMLNDEPENPEHS
ncbi:outer dense fiber protein 3-like [Hydractinia symbiolongicarpus]|uniref:outer dense fiber protein 3-like n=1 Tax=Hydractinia symbiolongicarpus TaxID=13093 RepID=UPI00254A54C6|nr:outer dense fiber protein 3-like [Hydractinia symbiolongicarpus]